MMTIKTNPPFVLIRDFNYEGDTQFGIYAEHENLYVFGDGDMYLPDQIRDGMMGDKVEWLSWMDVERRLCQ